MDRGSCDHARSCDVPTGQSFSFSPLPSQSAVTSNSCQGPCMASVSDPFGVHHLHSQSSSVDVNGEDDKQKTRFFFSHSTPTSQQLSSVSDANTTHVTINKEAVVYANATPNSTQQPRVVTSAFLSSSFPPTSNPSVSSEGTLKNSNMSSGLSAVVSGASGAALSARALSAASLASLATSSSSSAPSLHHVTAQKHTPEHGGMIGNVNMNISSRNINKDEMAKKNIISPSMMMKKMRREDDNSNNKDDDHDDVGNDVMMMSSASSSFARAADNGPCPLISFQQMFQTLTYPTVLPVLPHATVREAESMWLNTHLNAVLSRVRAILGIFKSITRYPEEMMHHGSGDIDVFSPLGRMLFAKMAQVSTMTVNHLHEAIVSMSASKRNQAPQFAEGFASEEWLGHLRDMMEAFLDADTFGWMRKVAEVLTDGTEQELHALRKERLLWQCGLWQRGIVNATLPQDMEDLPHLSSKRKRSDNKSDVDDTLDQSQLLSVLIDSCHRAAPTSDEPVVPVFNSAVSKAAAVAATAATTRATAATATPNNVSANYTSNNNNNNNNEDGLASFAAVVESIIDRTITEVKRDQQQLQQQQSRRTDAHTDHSSHVNSESATVVSFRSPSPHTVSSPVMPPKALKFGAGGSAFDAVPGFTRLDQSRSASIACVAPVMQRSVSPSPSSSKVEEEVDSPDDDDEDAEVVFSLNSFQKEDGVSSEGSVKKKRMSRKRLREEGVSLDPEDAAFVAKLPQRLELALEDARQMWNVLSKLDAKTVAQLSPPNPAKLMAEAIANAGDKEFIASCLVEAAVKPAQESDLAHQLQFLTQSERFGNLSRWWRLVHRSCWMAGLFHYLRNPNRKLRPLKTRYLDLAESIRRACGEARVYQFNQALRYEKMGLLLRRYPMLTFQAEFTFLNDWFRKTSNHLPLVEEFSNVTPEHHLVFWHQEHDPKYWSFDCVSCNERYGREEGGFSQQVMRDCPIVPGCDVEGHPLNVAIPLRFHCSNCRKKYRLRVDVIETNAMEVLQGAEQLQSADCPYLLCPIKVYDNSSSFVALATCAKYFLNSEQVDLSVPTSLTNFAAKLSFEAARCADEDGFCEQGKLFRRLSKSQCPISSLRRGLSGDMDARFLMNAFCRMYPSCSIRIVDSSNVKSSHDFGNSATAKVQLHLIHWASNQHYDILCRKQSEI